MTRPQITYLLLNLGVSGIITAQTPLPTLARIGYFLVVLLIQFLTTFVLAFIYGLLTEGEPEESPIVKGVQITIGVTIPLSLVVTGFTHSFIHSPPIYLAWSAHLSLSLWLVTFEMLLYLWIVLTAFWMLIKIGYRGFARWRDGRQVNRLDA